MPRSSLARAMALGLVWFGFALPARPQDDNQQRSTGYTAILDSIDLLVDNYARFLARKYDLTEEQDEYTKYLLRERSYQFLDRHEGELREALDRLFDVRSGGEMTQQELIEWGQRVKPIYEEAKKLIVDGNDEWREILTPEQQRIHDRDLKLMYESFETTEEQLNQILSGQMTVEEFRSPQRKRRPSRTTKPRQVPPAREAPPSSEHLPDEPPPPPPPPPDDTLRPSERVRRNPVRTAGEEGGDVVRPAGEGPPASNVEPRRGRRAPRPDNRTSARRPTSRRPGPTRVTTKQGFEGEWEKYVREFIEKYKLNDEQQQKAHAVLEDCTAQANRYQQGRKRQIEQFEEQIETLRKSNDKNKSQKIAELTEKRKKLMEPIDRIFEGQLKPRLERLPTRAQRREAEAAAKKGSGARKTPAKSPEKKPAGGDDE